MLDNLSERKLNNDEVLLTVNDLSVTANQDIKLLTTWGEMTPGYIRICSLQKSVRAKPSTALLKPPGGPGKN